MGLGWAPKCVSTAMKVENVEEENDDLKQKQCWWFSSGNQGLILPPPSLFPLMEKLLLSNQRWESKYIQRCDLASRTNLTLTYKSLTPPKDSALKSCVLVSPCACSCLQIILFCFLLNDQRGKILFARIDRSWEEKFSGAQTDAAHCSSIKLWANALSSSPLCFKYPFSTKQLWKPKIWGSSRVIYGTQKSSNKFDLKRKKGRGVTECLQRCQFVWQKNSRRLSSWRLRGANKSISSCNNCPTLGTLLPSPWPLHQIMLTLATSTRRDKYLLKWTSNRSWIKHNLDRW